MHPRTLLLIVTLAAGTLAAANGATAQIRSDSSAGASQLALAASLGPQIDAATLPDTLVWNVDKGETHIANAGFFSGIKKAAKGVAGTVKKVAGTATKTAGGVVKKVVGTGVKTAGTIKNVIGTGAKTGSTLVKKVIGTGTKVAGALAKKVIATGTKIAGTVAKKVIAIPTKVTVAKKVIVRDHRPIVRDHRRG